MAHQGSCKSPPNHVLYLLFEQELWVNPQKPQMVHWICLGNVTPSNTTDGIILEPSGRKIQSHSVLWSSAKVCCSPSISSQFQSLRQDIHGFAYFASSRDVQLVIISVPISRPMSMDELTQQSHVVLNSRQHQILQHCPRAEGWISTSQSPSIAVNFREG